MERIILATHNEHKTKEVRHILQDLGVEVLSLKDLGWTEEIVEDGLTFSDNAGSKVSAVVEKYPQEYIIADDSGLEVDILDGAPGVHSARYAGNDKSSLALCTKLIEATKLFPFQERTASFVTVLAFYQPTDRTIMAFEGTVNGLILEEMRGSNGFGYDPVFYLPELMKTMAELSSEEKDKLSHRHNALEKFKAYVKRHNV